MSTTSAHGKYYYAVGRRKTATATVRLYTKNGAEAWQVNGKTITAFFPELALVNIIERPIKASGQEGQVHIVAKVTGGGQHAQAEALQLGIARALIQLNPTFRTTLRKEGYLTRDPRAVERKKYGLKKARRAPQWAKR